MSKEAKKKHKNFEDILRNISMIEIIEPNFKNLNLLKQFTFSCKEYLFRSRRTGFVRLVSA